MIHLSDDDILQLAETIEENLILSKEQLEMMNHLKECGICYDKFCGAIALMEVTGESGSVYLSEIFAVQSVESLQSQPETKTLAILNVIMKTVRGKIETVIEQANVAGSAFRFQPSIAMGTRSVSGNRGSVHKVEDSNDEKTFIAIDSERKELLLQVNAKELSASGIKAYLQLSSGEKKEIQIERKGFIFIGKINNLPDEEATLVIYESC